MKKAFDSTVNVATGIVAIACLGVCLIGAALCQVCGKNKDSVLAF